MTNHTVLTWGQLSMDPRSRHVAYSSRGLSVTPKEYAILELFLRHSQRALSTRDIREQIWTSLESTEEEAIRARIRELRRKLTAAGAPKDFIKTQPRVGYQLNPLYLSFLAPKKADQLTTPQLAELNKVQEELQTTLEQLRSTQAELEQKNQELQAVRNELEQQVKGIDDRQHLEMTLQKNEEQLRLALELNGIGSWDWQIDSGSVSWDNNHFTVLGYRPGEVEPSYQHWRNRIHPDDLAVTEQKLQQALETQTDYNAEFRIVLDDGSIRWLASKGHGLYNALGELVRMVGVEFDISDRKQAEIERQQMSGALSNAVEGVSRLDDRGLYTFINEAYARMVGYTPEEMMGTTWERTVHPEDLESVTAAYRQMLSAGKVELEARGIRKDGSMFYKQLFMVATYDDRHRFISHYCFAKDITDRKQAELALQESEQRLQLFVRYAPVCVAMFDRTMHYLAASQRWVDVYQLGSIESVIGLSHYDLLSIPDHWQQIHQRGLAGVNERCDEDQYILPDGSRQWLKWEVQPWRRATGDVGGILIFVEDISDRKRAEQTLQETKQQLQAILDNSPAAIYLHDLQNNYVLVNRICAELIFKTPEEFVGKNVYELWPADIADKFVANNRTVLESGQLLQTEEVVPHPDGQPHTYITVKFPLYDATGEPCALCGISTDITEKKQLETQFYRAQRLESLGTLASGIAHDLNNVFTPILAMSQLLRLQYPNLDTRAQGMLKILEDSSKRGAEMIKQILTFSRGTGGEKVPTQVDAVLGEVVRVIQQSFPKSIEIQTVIPARFPWSVSADPTYLHQVLMNLCVNARDAMPEGGTLTLSVEPRFLDQSFAQTTLNAHVGHHVVVTIADTGTGIPLDVRDQIFDPFFTTKPQGQGTGLGLATVLGIVKNYDGFLQVCSEEGQGTQIKVYLPTTEAEGSTNINQPESQFHGHGELVLIVDDDVAVYQSTQALLESHQYTTLVANSGAEAIALYAQHQADVRAVILDIMMPDMNGILLIEKLRLINPTVKIMAMSGLSSNREPALATGATIFLAKPYSFEALLENLSHLVQVA